MPKARERTAMRAAARTESQIADLQRRLDAMILERDEFAKALDRARETAKDDRLAFGRVVATMQDRCDKATAARDSLLNECADLLSILAMNMEVIPDPRMKGAADCYRLPLDDGERIVTLSDKIRAYIL